MAKKKLKKTIAKKPVKKAAKKPAPKKSVKATKKPSRPVKKPVVKKVGKKKASALPAKGLTPEQIEERVQQLIDKGKKRRFLTYDEVLKAFPDVEEDVMFLDDLYKKFGDAGIDIIETGGLLSMDPTPDPDLAGRRYDRSASSNDSVQMYLKEIGKYPLIKAAEERELAQKIIAGDEEAKNLLAQANLRLVVSIAKKYATRSADLTLDRKSVV